MDSVVASEAIDPGSTPGIRTISRSQIQKRGEEPERSLVMEPTPNSAKSWWSRLLSAVGAFAFVFGAVDPLEGSVVILGGSVLLLAGEILRVGERRRLALWTSVFVLTAVGVAMMFFLSSLGGLGGDRGKSWWWGLLILPYPAGWLLGVGALVARGVRRVRSG